MIYPEWQRVHFPTNIIGNQSQNSVEFSTNLFTKSIILFTLQIDYFAVRSTSELNTCNKGCFFCVIATMDNKTILWFRSSADIFFFECFTSYERSQCRLANPKFFWESIPTITSYAFSEIRYLNTIIAIFVACFLRIHTWSIGLVKYISFITFCADFWVRFIIDNTIIYQHVRIYHSYDHA